MSELILIICIIISVGAQIKVTSTYKKYLKVSNKSGISGREIARNILDRHDLQNIGVECVSGFLTDHYDPKNKVVRLSESIYNGRTVSSVAVACHECGHAIQDKEGYFFMKVRSSMVPVVNFSSYAGYFAILLGCIFGSLDLIYLGIIAEIVILLFQVVTLPVEFDASKRGLKELKESNYFDDKEIKGGKKVLKAAAMTYVASVATTLLQVLRLLLMFTRRDR